MKFFSGYIQIHTPVLTSNDCEGGGEVFKIMETKPKQCPLTPSHLETDGTKPNLEYFDKPVFLTVSGQLHLEAICNGIAKVKIIIIKNKIIKQIFFAELSYF